MSRVTLLLVAALVVGGGYVGYVNFVDSGGGGPAAAEWDPSQAQDLDGDGNFMDLNGNDRMDSNDVVIYHQHMGQPELEDNMDKFDYNDNDRIDYDDLTLLSSQV